MRASERTFFGVTTLLFAFSAAVTIVWMSSMSSMGSMSMPGGWTMSMTWMLMPGQTWLEATVSFGGMWAMMMVAMMLPSLAPMLRRYRQVVGHSALLTLLVGAGYFFVWTLLGVVAFPLGVALANATMQVPALARAVPMAVGIIVVSAGLLQFTAWKARHLACCRGAMPVASNALMHGVRLGIHCTYCCAGLTAILLVVGVMDLRVMAVVTVAITAERLAGQRVARAIGVVIVAAGLFLMARAT